MIKVPITSRMKQTATRSANRMGRIHNSITRGKGNAYGFLGEQIAKLVLGGEIVNKGKKYNVDYDLILDDGTTVEVKTKKTTVKPKDYYECSVAKYNTKQKCDYYAFVRVLDTKENGWFLGVMPKEKYFINAKFLKAGTRDGDNGFLVKADCYNLAISQLQEKI
tara:strand:+ start:466 stop:957 length:492 start_codon:yes stop_codon:yes gene_type:complete